MKGNKTNKISHGQVPNWLLIQSKALRHGEKYSSPHLHCASCIDLHQMHAWPNENDVQGLKNEIAEVPPPLRGKKALLVISPGEMCTRVSLFQRNDSTQVPTGEPMNLLCLLSGTWERDYLEVCGWLEGPAQHGWRLLKAMPHSGDPSFASGSFIEKPPPCKP